MVDNNLRRRGFTLIEALVGAAVITLLCTLIVPFIHYSREAARRDECKNHLKQIGLALHNYHEVCNTFPPGFVIGANDVYHGWSWSLHIVPYLDANPWYNEVQFQAGLQTEYLKPELHPHLSLLR